MVNGSAVLPLAGLVVVLTAVPWLNSPGALAQTPGAGATCPVPLEQLHRGPRAANSGVDVCVDRGDGAVYVEGEPITVCVTVSVPVILIYPPPPDPMVRVTNSTNGGPERAVLEERFNGGHRCFAGVITPPLGQDLFRAQVLGQGGGAIAQDEVRLVSVPQ
jgi:hypothetical protein